MSPLMSPLWVNRQADGKRAKEHGFPHTRGGGPKRKRNRGVGKDAGADAVVTA